MFIVVRKTIYLGLVPYSDEGHITDIFFKRRTDLLSYANGWLTGICGLGHRLPLGIHQHYRKPEKWVLPTSTGDYIRIM